MLAHSSPARPGLRPHQGQGLYDPANEHDACGVAFVADMHGRKSHRIVERGIEALCNLEHRGAAGAEVNTGDGAQGAPLRRIGPLGTMRGCSPEDPSARRQQRGAA